MQISGNMELPWIVPVCPYSSILCPLHSSRPCEADLWGWQQLGPALGKETAVMHVCGGIIIKFISEMTLDKGQVMRKV